MAAITAVQAATVNDPKSTYITASANLGDTLGTVLVSDGVTILVGATASHNTNMLSNTIDRLRDRILEDNK